jgi:hypothetical protein
MEDRLQWPEGESLNGVTRTHGWGYYHNRYEMTEGGWRISGIALERLRVETGAKDMTL